MNKNNNSNTTGDKKENVFESHTPRLALDCDGVLARFVEHLLAWAYIEKKPAQITQYDMWKCMTSSQRRAAWLAMSHPDFWATMPTMEGAEWGVMQLTAKYDVRVLTKPWRPCHTWTEVRYKWLQAHFNLGAGRVIFASDKSWIVPDIIIDDNPDYLLYSDAKRKLLFNQPYNQTFYCRCEEDCGCGSDIERVYSWKDLIKKLSA